MLRKFSVMVILLLAVSSADAEMYQWVDEQGVVTFKDTPPPSSGKRGTVKVYGESDFAPAPAPQPAPLQGSRSKPAPALQSVTAAQERFTGTVELYVTSWCGYCKRAQKYLQDRGVPYVVYDIEQDPAANKRHKELGGRGVPLIVIGEHKISGFSPESIEFYLNNGK